LYLFTLIVKLSIRDNTHPLSRSWNSSSDVKVVLMLKARQRATRTTFTDCSKEFVVSRGDTFIGAFVTCHKFTIKHRLFLYCHIWLKRFAYARLQFHSHLRGIDEIRCAWNLSRYYTIFERDFSLNESLLITAVCTCIITAKMYKTSLQLNFCTLESRDPSPQKLFQLDKMFK